jgi:hypothetical protein
VPPHFRRRMTVSDWLFEHHTHLEFDYQIIFTRSLFNSFASSEREVTTAEESKTEFLLCSVQIDLNKFSS